MVIKDKKIFYMYIFLVGLVVLMFLPKEVYAAKDYDVRSELTEGVTPETAIERLEKLNYGHSPFVEHMDFIFEESLKRGINPTYMLGIMSLESTYGTSSYAKANNNFGGIGGDNAHQFDKPEDGLLAGIELIEEYITKGKNGEPPMHTIGEIKKVYCPASDGCNPKYVSEVMSIMKGFGQDIEDEGAIMKGDSSESKKDKKNDGDDDNKTAKGAKDFKERDYADGDLGVRNTNNFIGGDLFLVIQNSSNNVMKVLMYVGVFLVGVLLLFTSTSVVSYLVLSTYGGSSETIGKFEKVTGTSLVREKKTMNQLMGRWVIVMVIVTIFLTGMYAYIMTGILSFLESITDFIFGLGG